MPEETKVSKEKTSLNKRIEEDLKRRREMNAEDFKKLDTCLVTISKIKTKSGNEFVTLKAQIDPNYENGYVETDRNNALDLLDFDLIVTENHILKDPSEKISSFTLKCPVRFLKGYAQGDGQEYKRVELFLAKNVYRSIFLSYRLVTMLNYKGSKINFQDDFIKQEVTDVVFEVEND